jgi:hypothetical protein
LEKEKQVGPAHEVGKCMDGLMKKGVERQSMNFRSPTVGGAGEKTAEER